MPVEVILPRVDMDMTAGRLSRWLVAEGARVAKGEPLFEIETDKAAMEIEAPATGTLRDVRAAEGEDIAVGSPIAWIYAEGETHAAPQASVPTQPGTAASMPVAPTPIAPTPIAPASAAPVLAAPISAAPAPAEPALVRATPLARRLAANGGLDLAALSGSGPRGRVCAGDVEALLAERPAAPPPEQLIRRHDQTLHRVRMGTDSGTPIVLLHGFASDLSTWRPLWALLERAHPVLAIDLPGHGKSSTDASRSPEAMADAVSAVLEQEGVTRLHLVGHSLGGAVAMALAASAAIEVRSLCLLAPAGLGPDINGAFLDGLARATREESLAPWLRLLYADPAPVTPGFVRAALRARTAATWQAELAQALFPDGTQGFDLRPMLRPDYPAKLVWGVRDRIIPARHAQGLPAALGVHLLPDVGHLPHQEAPALVARLVEELARAAA